MTKEELDFIGAMNMCDEISNKAYQKIVNHFEETQPSEDCVSRAELKKWLDINFSFGGALRKLEMFDRIDKELPPVTPAHGTCKDCTNYVKGALDEEICLRGHELIHENFYCADFEKRGTD